MKALGLLVLVALSAGGWWAWERGHVPGNPRALSAAAMRPALERQLASAPQGAQGGCVGADLRHPRPEIEGQEGIGQRPLPGQYAVALLLQPRVAEQEARSRQLAQMDFLARQGFYHAAELAVLTDAGPRAARRYVLGWKGYAQAGLSRDGTPCFRVGEPALEAIEAMEKLPEALAGLEAWSVTYRMGVRGVPAWAASEEARALFPGLRSRTEPARAKAVLLRGEDGWLSQAQARQQLLEPRDKDHAARAAPALEAATARALLEEQVLNACLPVRLQRGGDERAAAPEGEFRVAYYDLAQSARPAYSRGLMVSALHVLHALEAVGFASSEPTGPGEVLLGRVKLKAARGVRYRVAPEALAALGVGRGNPCIPAGRLKLELLALHAGAPGHAQLQARGRITEAPEWVRRLAGHLPALKLALAEGVPLSGQLGHGAGGWAILSLLAHYPEIRSDSVPARLRGLLPQTEAAHPVLQ